MYRPNLKKQGNSTNYNTKSILNYRYSNINFEIKKNPICSSVKLYRKLSNEINITLSNK